MTIENRPFQEKYCLSIGQIRITYAHYESVYILGIRVRFTGMGSFERIALN